MMRFIISMFLGVIPDVLYYFLYLKSIKQIKRHNVLFFVLLLVSYIVLNIIIKHNFYLYLLFDVSIFLIIKLLYKAKITDMLLIVVLELYLIIGSSLCYILLGNYIVAYVMNRLIIFLPLLFRSKLKDLYVTYNKLWNRHNNPKMLKSITLRNITVVLVNFLVVISYILLIYIMTIPS